MTDKRYGRYALAAAMLAATGIAGTGYATAAPARTTLNYTCNYGEAMQAAVTWDGPATVPIGRATPTITVNALATMDSMVTGYLNLAGMAAIAGTVNAPGTVAAPEGNIPSALRLTVPRTPVPASGALSVPANGVTPQLVFHQAGHATISVGNTLAMHFDTWDANGNSKGEYDLSCTLDSGPSAIVYQFDITAPPVAPPTSTTTRTATAGIPAGTVPASTTAVNSTGSPPSRMVVSGTPQATGTSSSNATAAKAKIGELAATPTAFWGSGPGRTDWWLAVGGIVAVGMSLIGGGWWLMRRRARR